jgi:formamidopyrimidine-DNA glycosylase
MPELPEVETIRRDLARVIVGKKITHVEVLHRAPIKDGVKKFTEALQNKKLKHIDRIGKLLMLDLSDGHFLLIHLKMTGQLIYRHDKTIIAGGHSFSAFKPDELPGAYTWVIWNFDDGSVLYFNDMRKFGYLKIVDRKEKEMIVSGYGLEPLTKNFTLKNFLKILEKRNAPIKAVLLNQALIAGIGNIYADEICFAAKIFPGTRTSVLSSLEKTKLFNAINIILKKAIKYKGTTFKNYVSAHGKKGNFSDFLQVYKRDKQKCFVCKKGIVSNKKIGGRSSRYCPVCQKVLQ